MQAWRSQKTFSRGSVALYALELPVKPVATPVGLGSGQDPGEALGPAPSEAPSSAVAVVGQPPLQFQNRRLIGSTMILRLGLGANRHRGR